MTEKQFRITTNPKSNAVAFDEKQKKHYIGIDLEDLLNEQQAPISALKEENEQLRTQLLLCQQSKDGRFQVGEVPPITVGRTISFSTNGDD